MKKTDIVILVSQKYVKEPYVDDIALKYLLEKKGCKTEIVAWDDLDYDFSLTHIALIRSCWDYDQRICEFIKKMKSIAQQTRLINPIDMILQNTNKLYLKKLKRVGVEIVPTVFISNLKEIEPTLQNIEWGELIIKPVISASGRNTYKIKKQDKCLCYEIIQELLKNGDVIVQRYLESIETHGEKSIVVIDGKITYAMLKKPKNNGFLVHLHHGGTYIPDIIKKDETAFVEKVQNTFDEQPAYMRIDLLRESKQDKLMLLELELIEPNLYLSKNKEGLNRLSEYLIRQLH